MLPDARPDPEPSRLTVQPVGVAGESERSTMRAVLVRKPGWSMRLRHVSKRFNLPVIGMTMGVIAGLGILLSAPFWVRGDSLYALLFGFLLMGFSLFQLAVLNSNRLLDSLLRAQPAEDVVWEETLSVPGLYGQYWTNRQMIRLFAGTLLAASFLPSLLLNALLPLGVILGLPVAGTFFAVIVYRRMNRKNDHEEALCRTTAGCELQLCAEGLHCALGLLDARLARRLALAERAWLFIPWSAIEAFIVPYANPVLVGRRPTESEQAFYSVFYKLRLAPAHQVVSLLRLPFFGRERELFRMLESRLPCPLTLYDKPH